MSVWIKGNGIYFVNIDIITIHNLFISSDIYHFAYNAAAVTLKDSTGHIYFAAAGAEAGSVTTASLSRGMALRMLPPCHEASRASFSRMAM